MLNVLVALAQATISAPPTTIPAAPPFPGTEWSDSLTLSQLYARLSQKNGRFLPAYLPRDGHSGDIEYKLHSCIFYFEIALYGAGTEPRVRTTFPLETDDATLLTDRARQKRCVDELNGDRLDPN